MVITEWNDKWNNDKRQMIDIRWWMLIDEWWIIKGIIDW